MQLKQLAMAAAIAATTISAQAQTEIQWWHSMSAARSEEHTSELQSPCNLVCRLLLEKKKHLKFFVHQDLSRCCPVVTTGLHAHCACPFPHFVIAYLISSSRSTFMTSLYACGLSLCN